TNLLSKDHFIVVVATMEKVVVGGLAGYVLEKFEQQRREIYIYDLAVSDAHRRKGVATGTINALKKIAAGQDAYVIFAQADLEDGPAIALYRSLGTLKPAHHFDIEVGPIKVRGRLIESQVRSGSKADIRSNKSDVRFTPNSGHWWIEFECPLCAK